MTIVDDFFSLMYPHICCACGRSLYKYEKCFCTFCLYHLPKTNFHHDEENPVSRLFWGRSEKILAATAYYYYNKNTKVQHLIHQLKYKGHKEIGVYIGNIFGKDIMNFKLFNSVDVVVPVPLHPKKEMKRGYNQSAMFAEGIAESMNIIIDKKNLIRIYASETQTKKTRFARWENVSKIFDIKNKTIFENKHVLLVDDVITTGATIEACANALSTIDNIKISVAAIAIATH